MAKSLKKFVNPTFIKTIDLTLMGHLLERHRVDLKGLNSKLLIADEASARSVLQDFFAGSEENYPDGLKADLHQIAELGNSNGVRLLLERAKALNVVLIPKHEIAGPDQHLDPKHVALRAFLEHPRVFEAASDFLSIEARLSLSEFSGSDEDVHPEIDETTKSAFEEEASALFGSHLQGLYCRVGWYDDEDEINIVVSHGTEIVTTPAVKDGAEAVVSYRPIEYAHLAYDPALGRMKVGGVAKALRPKLAEIFAATMLGRPGFFAHAGSEDLYTLEHIERTGFGFLLDRGFDPDMSRAAIVEAEVERLPADGAGPKSTPPWSIIVRDRINALERLGQVAPRVAFGDGGYRLGYIVIGVSIENGEKRPIRLRAKVKPPEMASFKRHRFEDRIMTLLRRNKLCRDRKPRASSAAAD